MYEIIYSTNLRVYKIRRISDGICHANAYKNFSNAKEIKRRLEAELIRFLDKPKEEKLPKLSWKTR